MDPKSEAIRIKGELEDAAGEVAYEEYRNFRQYGECNSEGMTRMVKRLKKSRCQDIPGSMADTLFGQADFCRDIVGDRIFWASDDWAVRAAIVTELEGMAHRGLKQALQEIRKDHKELEVAMSQFVVGDRVQWNVYGTHTGTVKKIYEKDVYLSGCPTEPFYYKGDLRVAPDNPAYDGHTVIVHPKSATKL